jgi:protein SCO1/2
MRYHCSILQATVGFRRLVLALGLLLLAGCSRSGPPWATKDISGLMPPLAFTLTEASRNTVVHATDYRGRVLLMYFGYMHCPDICPTTLSRLQSAVANLGDQAQQVRILFVSVDPKRDNLPDLRRYAEFFGPQVIGLRGSQAALRKLTKRYRVTYGYDKPDVQGNYNVSHSSAVYVFDRNGKARLLVQPDDPAEAISRDLKRLLATG